MDDSGVADDRPYSRRPATVVLSLFALGVAGLFGYLGYADSATVRVEGFGYVIEPAGRVMANDDAVVIQYPMDTVPRLRLRVPVRNTSRLPLTVRYAADVGSDVWGLEENPVLRSVRVAPGKTVWLEFGHAYEGCPETLQITKNVITGRGGFPVWIKAPGTGERQDFVELPIDYLHPQVELPARCRGLQP